MPMRYDELADADVEGDPSLDDVDLADHHALQGFQVCCVVHGADEVKQLLVDPVPPVLTHPVDRARPAEDGGGDHNAGPNAARFLGHGADESCDLVPPPLGVGACQRAREDIVRPLLDVRARVAGEAPAAAIAVACLAVGIADVVEMNPGHLVLAHDLQHGVALESEVARIGGAEPEHLRAVGVPLKPALGTELVHELGRCVCQVVVHLPDVQLDAELLAPVQASGDLVTFRRYSPIHRQVLTRIVSDAGPEEIGEHCVEAMLLQDSDRTLPSPAGHAIAIVHPYPPEFVLALRRGGDVG